MKYEYKITGTSILSRSPEIQIPDGDDWELITMAATNYNGLENLWWTWRRPKQFNVEMSVE